MDNVLPIKIADFIKKNALLLVIGCVGIFLFGFVSVEKKETDSPTFDEYRADTESKIAQMCMQVNGIYGVSVLVTLDDTVSASTGGVPRVCGIAVVCHGSSDRVRAELTELLSSAYSLPTNKIYIVEGG